jgi:hypothetical protein
VKLAAATVEDYADKPAKSTKAATAGFVPFRRGFQIFAGNDKLTVICPHDYEGWMNDVQTTVAALQRTTKNSRDVRTSARTQRMSDKARKKKSTDVHAKLVDSLINLKGVDVVE